MKPHPRLGPAMAALWIVPGLLSIAGGLALLWGSQDAMLVLIHWVGEGRALGPQNVIPQPGGGELLTNPSSMVRWIALIWAVGTSQIMAGGCLLWRAATVFAASPKSNR